MLAVAVACEVVINFIARSEKQNYTITLSDFAIGPLVIE
jgi:molybdopterin-synthase adenylyltransferase